MKTGRFENTSSQTLTFEGQGEEPEIIVPAGDSAELPLTDYVEGLVALNMLAAVKTTKSKE